MNKLRRDSLREGLKVKGRSRREVRQTEAEKASRPRRNDILPLLKIESYAVDALKSHARKLRKSDPVHVREIADSISTLGFNVPLLIGKDNVVVDGDSRLQAAKLLGLSSVPCIRVDHLDETEQRLLRLAVNRLGEKGFWDVGELEAEFKELIIAEAPIEISGFGSDEIDQVVIGGNEDGCEAGDLAPLPGASASARINDLFLLGSHLVICGDATDPAVVRRLMRTDVARMVLTDEPFKVATGAQLTGGEHREFVMASGEMTDSQFLDFNQKWMDAVLPHLSRRRNPRHLHRLARTSLHAYRRNGSGVDPSRSGRMGKNERRHGPVSTHPSTSYCRFLRKAPPHTSTTFRFASEDGIARTCGPIPLPPLFCQTPGKVKRIIRR